jgi:hypothetical protein
MPLDGECSVTAVQCKESADRQSASPSSTPIDLSDADEIEPSLEVKEEPRDNDMSLALSVHKAFAFTRKELEDMPVPSVINDFLRNQDALHRAFMQLDSHDIKPEAPKVNIQPQLSLTDGRSEWTEEKITKAFNRLSELCRQGIIKQMRQKVSSQTLGIIPKPSAMIPLLPPARKQMLRTGSLQ